MAETAAATETPIRTVAMSTRSSYFIVAMTQMIYQHVADRLKKQAANQTAAFILGDQAT
jgi:hypothetical protein